MIHHNLHHNDGDPGVQETPTAVKNTSTITNMISTVTESCLHRYSTENSVDSVTIQFILQQLITPLHGWGIHRITYRYGRNILARYACTCTCTGIWNKARKAMADISCACFCSNSGLRNLFSSISSTKASCV